MKGWRHEVEIATITSLPCSFLTLTTLASPSRPAASVVAMLPIVEFELLVLDSPFDRLSRRGVEGRGLRLSRVMKAEALGWGPMER